MLKHWVVAIAVISASVANAQVPMTGAGQGAMPGNIQIGGGSSGCSQATSFLNRTSGLDAAHRTNYTNLICGMVTDGTLSLMDVLYVFATQNTPTAVLNLIGANATATIVGNPAFQVDRGYAGTDTGFPATDYLNSNFNPFANGVNFMTNTAHISAWSVTDSSTVNGGVLFGVNNGSQTSLFDTFHDGNIYFRINDVSGGEAGNQGAPTPSRAGHWLIDRTTSANTAAYHNGASYAAMTPTSGSPPNANVYILAKDNVSAGNSDVGTPNQLAMTSIGGNMSASQITNFYNRLRTYMTAVGVP